MSASASVVSTEFQQQAEPHRERARWNRLLASLRATHSDEVGSAYEYVRHRLLQFFRRRQSAHAEELADETFNRMERKLSDGTAIQDPERYLLGVARLLWAETIRQERSCRLQLAALVGAEPEDSAGAEKERDLRERCLGELPAEDLDLLVRYYVGSGQERIRRRQALARERGTSINHLRVRVHRLRNQIAWRIEELRTLRSEGSHGRVPFAMVVMERALDHSDSKRLSR